MSKCKCGFPEALNTAWATWQPVVIFHTWWVGNREWGYICEGET